MKKINDMLTNFLKYDFVSGNIKNKTTKVKDVSKNWNPLIEKMTYILASKINNKCFIVVDKVINFDPTQPTVDKTYTSITNPDINLSVSGSGYLMDLIKDYDIFLEQKNIKLIIDDSTIKILGEKLESYLSIGETIHAIYLINNGRIFRYILYFDINVKYQKYDLLEILDGEILMNFWNNSISINNLNLNVNSADDLILFIKQQYEIKYNKGEVNHLYDTKTYFKDGFNSIEI